jgi:hypothetical protein
MEHRKVQGVRFSENITSLPDERPRTFRRSLPLVRGVVLATILYFCWSYVVPRHQPWVGQLPLNHKNASLVGYDDVSIRPQV